MHKFKYRHTPALANDCARGVEKELRRSFAECSWCVGENSNLSLAIKSCDKVECKLRRWRIIAMEVAQNG
jgi:hypothetical protein